MDGKLITAEEDEEEGEVEISTYKKIMEVFGGKYMIIFIIISSFLNHYVSHYIRIVKSDWAKVKPDKPS